MTSEVATTTRTGGAVAAATLPVILGTTILGALAAFQHSNLPEQFLVGAFFAVTWIPAFIGAAYGPILIPLGAVVLFRAKRINQRSRVFEWLLIGGALLATVVSYRWVLDAVELP